MERPARKNNLWVEEYCAYLYGYEVKVSFFIALLFYSLSDGQDIEEVPEWVQSVVRSQGMWKQPVRQLVIGHMETMYVEDQFSQERTLKFIKRHSEENYYLYGAGALGLASGIGIFGSQDKPTQTDLSPKERGYVFLGVSAGLFSMNRLSRYQRKQIVEKIESLGTRLQDHFFEMDDVESVKDLSIVLSLKSF